MRAAGVIFAGILIFLLALAVFFPYESFLRYQISRLIPNLACDTMEASVWSGIRLGHVRMIASGASSGGPAADEIRITLASLVPPKARIRIARGQGNIDITAGGPRDAIRFTINAPGLQVAEWFAGSDLPRISCDFRGEGAFSLETRTLAAGAKFSFDRIAGEFPASSPLALAAERAVGMTGWSSLWGNTVREGSVEMEYRGGAMQLTSIRIKTDGEFTGTAEIRPMFPIAAARMRIQGQASLGGKTVPIDNTIAFGDMLR